MTDFFNFDRYLTPSIIRIFYVLQLVLIGLFTLVGAGGALVMMTNSVTAGLLYLILIVFSSIIGVIGARIVTEIIMVLFQNNEHLAVIRARAEGGVPPA